MATSGTLRTNTNTFNTDGSGATVQLMLDWTIASQSASGTVINWDHYVRVYGPYASGDYFRSLDPINVSSGLGTRLRFPNCTSATVGSTTYTSSQYINVLNRTSAQVTYLCFDTKALTQVGLNGAFCSQHGHSTAYADQGTPTSVSTFGYSTGTTVSTGTYDNYGGTRWKTLSGTVTLPADATEFQVILQGWCTAVSITPSGNPNVYYNNASSVASAPITPATTYSIIYHANGGGTFNAGGTTYTDSGYVAGSTFVVANASDILTANTGKALNTSKTWSTNTAGTGTRFIPSATYKARTVTDADFTTISGTFNGVSSGSWHYPYTLKVRGQVKDNRLYYLVTAECKNETSSSASATRWKDSGGSGTIKIGTTSGGSNLVNRSLSARYGESVTSYYIWDEIGNRSVKGNETNLDYYQSVSLEGITATTLYVSATYTGSSAATYPIGTATASGTWTLATDTGGNQYDLQSDLNLYAIWDTTTQPGSVTTAPSGKTLKYSGSAQQLVTAGSGTGTMYYYVSTTQSTPAKTASGWTTNISSVTGTDAGTYYIYYYTGETSANYATDVAGPATSTISKADNTLTVTTPQSSSINYSSSATSVSFTGGSNSKGGLSYSITSQANSSGTTVSYFSIPTTGTAAFSVAANTPAGTYTIAIKVHAAGNSNYKSADLTITYTLTINKLAGSGDVTMSGWEYGKAVTNPTPTSSTNGTSNVTYIYYNSSKSVISKPTSSSNAGTYYVKATFAATTNYNEYTTDYKSFEITKTTGTGTVSITGWKYGDMVSAPVTSTSTNGSATITYYNSSKTAISAPTSTSAPGTYYVRATFAATTNYNEYTTGYVSFTISKGDLVVTTTNYSGTYNGAAHNATIKVTSSGWDGKTIVSGTSTSYGSTVTSTGAVNTSYNLLPAQTNVTTATVYYKVTGGTNYNDKTGTATVTITKNPSPITTEVALASGRVYNGNALQLVTAFATASGTGKVGVGTATTAPTTWYGNITELTGTDVGTYYVWYKVDSSTNYETVEATLKGSVTISKAASGIAITATQSGSTSTSTSAQTKTITAATGASGTVTYAVTGQTSAYGDVSYFSMTGTTLNIPANTPAGTYTITITATDPGDANHLSGTATTTYTLTIANQAPTVTVTKTTEKYSGGSILAVSATAQNCTYTLGYSTTNSTSAITWATAGSNLNCPDTLSPGVTYYIWYKATGASGYSNISTTSAGTLTIAYQTYTVSYNKGNASTGTAPSSQTKTYGTTLDLRTNTGNLAKTSTTGTAKTVTITYNANEGTCSTTSANISITPVTSYIMNGWTTSSGGTIMYALGGQYTDNNAITLYPAWQEVIENTGGSVTLPTATRADYNFKGWYINSASGMKAGDAGDTYTPSANVTLVARWAYAGTVDYSNYITQVQMVDGSIYDIHDKRITTGSADPVATETGDIYIQHEN